MSVSLPLNGEPLPVDAPFLRVYRILVGDDGEDNHVDIGAQATYELLSLPAGAVVLGVFSRVITAFTASVTLTVGDGDSAAGYLASADIAPQTAVAEALVGSILGGEALANGKNYSVADTIDIVVGGADVAAGQLELFVLVAFLGDEEMPVL